MKTFKLSQVPVFRRSLLSSAVVLASFGLVACGSDGDLSTSSSRSTTDSVTNPTQEFEQERQVTGTLQGVLRDRVTGNPIVGAVISIGLVTAETDEVGQYVMENVPVTRSTFDGDGGEENYRVSIDLREATSGSEDHDYPDVYYTTAAVSFGRFTPLEAEEIAGDNLEQGTFHQVISGLVSAYDWEVGKLSTSVSGKVVAGPNELSLAPHQVLEGASVYLYQTSADQEGVSSNRMVASATTDADGHFSFDSVEAGAELRLVAFFEEDGEEYFGEVGGTFTAPKMDGEELKFSVLDGPAIEGLRGPALQLNKLENQGPVLSGVSPENHSDMMLEDGSVEVRFHFNRPIRENAYSQALDPSSAAVEGLYQDVLVSYNGTKIDHDVLRPEDESEPGPNYTLSWDDNQSVLVVSMENLATAASYSVDISGTAGKLVDSMNRSVDFGAHSMVAGPVLQFTTRGAGAPSIPDAALAVTAVNTGDDIILEWNQVANARAYRVYTQRVELSGDIDTYLPGYWEEAETTAAHHVETADLISDNGHPMALYFKVTAVNADGIESDYSEVVGPITDTVAPDFVVAPATTVNLSGPFMTLNLDEPVRAWQEEEGDSITVLLPDANEEPIFVLNAEVNELGEQLYVQLSNAIAVPSFDDVADESLGEVRTGWNGIWRSLVTPAMNEHGPFDQELVSDLPPESTGLCMVVENQDGLLFSRNSNDYADGIPLELNLFGLELGDDAMVQREDEETGEDAFYIYTGRDGVCQSVTSLLNHFHDSGNTDNATNAPWIQAAEADDANDPVTENDYAQVATWALTELENATLDSVSLEVDTDHFRLSTRVESLTLLALNGVEEFWTEPNDLSHETLSQLTQNDDRSRPGSGAPLLPFHHYFVSGTAPADPRPNVLYLDDDPAEQNFAWRGTDGTPATNEVIYTFRYVNEWTNYEGLNEEMVATGHATRDYVLNEFERTVEILHIAPNALEDAADNGNSGYTLTRTYTRSEDMTVTTMEDEFVRD